MTILERNAYYRVVQVTDKARYFRQGPAEPQVGDIVHVYGDAYALMAGGTYCWAIEEDGDGYGTQFAAADLELYVHPAEAPAPSEPIAGQDGLELDTPAASEPDDVGAVS